MKISLTRRQKKWAIVTASVVVVLLLIITFLPMVVRKVAVSQIAARMYLFDRSMRTFGG